MPLTSALRDWRRWGLDDEPRLIKTFTNGQNHNTGLISAGGQRYVLKIFSHSFERAIAAERLANQLDISPTLVYAANDIALFDYITSPADPEITLLELAQTLAKVHKEPALGLEQFDLLRFYDEYLTTADDITRAWHKALLPILNDFIQDPTPWCFCHNDLVQENFLTGDKLYVIDWEFAQQHNPWFDLAAIILYFKLDRHSAREFLELYQAGWSEKLNYAIFYTSQISLLWGDLLWNMNKFGNDYRSKNKPRFERLEKLAAKLDIELPSEAN